MEKGRGCEKKKGVTKKRNVLKVLTLKRWACRPAKHTLNFPSAIADYDIIEMRH